MISVLRAVGMARPEIRNPQPLDRHAPTPHKLYSFMNFAPIPQASAQGGDGSAGRRQVVYTTMTYGCNQII